MTGFGESGPSSRHKKSSAPDPTRPWPVQRSNYWITSSVSANNVGGTARPRALAVLRLASDLLFLRYAIFEVAEWRRGMGIEMDGTALNELIAQVRGTAATLAEAEQRVAAFTAELAHQKLPNVSPALLKSTPAPKRASFGWLPANK